MAIQHTPTEWVILTNRVNGITVYYLESTMGAEFGDEQEANAVLIEDAVNNTAGNGIDPNAVPKLLKTLVDMAEMKSTPEHIKEYARQAIKAAELK